MRTPLSLRITRLLLVGAGAGALGVFVFVLSAASAFAPIVLVFPGSAIVLLFAARQIGVDERGGRLLAVAGASGLAGMGVLAGFGAGTVSLPVAALGVAAAWGALLHPPRRQLVLALALYLAVGVTVVLFGRVPLSLFAIWSPLLWPWLGVIWTGPASWLAIYVSFGATAALVALYAAHRARIPVGRVSLAPLTPLVALSAGALAVIVYAAIALADESSSLRFELQPQPIAILFLAGALFGVALVSLLRAPAIAAAALGVAMPIFLVAVTGGPTVSCYPSGTRTSGSGPWWMPYSGPLSSSGGGGSDRGFSGEVRRGDSVVIRYRCAGGRLVEFSIEP